MGTYNFKHIDFFLKYIYIFILLNVSNTSGFMMLCLKFHINGERFGTALDTKRY